jgi:ABC-2 type transport system permease protein
MNRWSTIWAIIEKEMYVFFKYFHSEVSFAVIFPVLMIWTMEVGLGDAQIGWLPEGVSYATFIMPGLIMMTVISTGFFNTGFVIMFEKEYSDAFDGLVQTPVTTSEIALAKILSGTLKSLINGLISLAVVLVFVDVSFSPGWVLLPVIFAACGFFFSCIGLAMGTWLKRGYQLGTLGNMLIFPMTFFGGLFFSVSQIPDSLQNVVNVNPVTWMITALREVVVYGGWDVGMELLGVLVISLILYLGAWRLFHKLVIN